MNNTASPLNRLCAFVIDAAIWLILELVIFSQVTTASEIPVILDNLLSLIIVIIFGGLVYGVLNSVLTSRFGGSIGKLIMGLQIINSEGRRITFWRAVLRHHVGYFVSGTFAWLGFVWIIKDKEHRGWHDLLADTYVVSKNKTGAFVGLLLAVALLIWAGYLTVSIFSQINSNIPMYKEVFEDIKTELVPSPTPKTEFINNSPPTPSLNLREGD